MNIPVAYTVDNSTEIMIPFQWFRHVNYVDVFLLQNVLLGVHDTVMVWDGKTMIIHGTEQQHGNLHATPRHCNSPCPKYHGTAMVFYFLVSVVNRLGYEE